MLKVLKSAASNFRRENLVKVFRSIFPENKLFIMIIAYTVVLSIVTIVKHSFFLSTGWDLGIFNQTFWSTIHGRFFHYTVEPWLGETFFATHFSPILIFLIPFYAIYPQPETLLVLQSLIIALGAVPLYHLARDVLSKSFAIKLSLVYIINPMIVGANLFDFHVELFLPITLLSLIYFLHKRNFKLYTLFLFLSLSTLEFTAFLTLFIIIYELVVNIKRKDEIKRLIPFASLTIIASILWLFISFLVTVNLRAPETTGQSILMPIITSLLENPYSLISQLAMNPFPKLWYILEVSWPFFFTPFLSSYFLLSLPWLLVAFTLNYGAYYTIGYQYSLVVIPFFAVSSIYGMKRLLFRIRLNEKKIANLIMISTLIFSMWAYTSLQFPVASFNVEYANKANRIIDLIPENASVLTINNLHPHISSRFEAWLLPPSYDEPYKGFETGISTIWKEYATNFLRTTEPDFVFWDINNGGIDAYNLNLTIYELLPRVHYGVYASLGEILLLKKGYEGAPVIYEPFNHTSDATNLASCVPSQMVEDSTSRSGKVLVCTSSKKDVTFWKTSTIFLPHGRFLVNFRVKVSSMISEVADIFMVEVCAENASLKSAVISTMDVEENEWKELCLEFEVKNTLACVSLRGVALSVYTELYMDYIDIIQRSY